MKNVHLSSGKITFRPFKTYCFQSLKKSLIDLLEHQGFYDECWKQRALYQENANFIDTMQKVPFSANFNDACDGL